MRRSDQAGRTVHCAPSEDEHTKPLPHSHAEASIWRRRTAARSLADSRRRETQHEKSPLRVADTAHASGVGRESCGPRPLYAKLSMELNPRLFDTGEVAVQEAGGGGGVGGFIVPPRAWMLARAMSATIAATRRARKPTLIRSAGVAVRPSCSSTDVETFDAVILSGSDSRAVSDRSCSSQAGSLDDFKSLDVRACRKGVPQKEAPAGGGGNIGGPSTVGGGGMVAGSTARGESRATSREASRSQPGVSESARGGRLAVGVAAISMHRGIMSSFGWTSLAAWTGLAAAAGEWLTVATSLEVGLGRSMLARVGMESSAISSELGVRRCAGEASGVVRSGLGVREASRGTFSSSHGLVAAASIGAASSGGGGGVGRKD